MKKILFAVLSALTVTAYAQSPISVNVDKQASTQKTNSVYTVDIPQNTLKDVKKDWLKYVGNNSEGKSSFVNGEYIQTGTVNTNISPNSFTLYSTLLETTAGVRVTAWMGDNKASTSETAKSNQDLAVQKFLKDFAIGKYREAVQAEFKTEEKELSKMEKDLKCLVKEKEKYTKIKNANERSNAQAGDAIATNKSDIKATNEKISDQKEMVQLTAPDPNANKGAQKTLDEIENEKQDLQKENEKKSKNIDERKKENRAADRKLATAEQNYDAKIIAIAKQKEAIATVQTKLNNIK